MIIIDDALPKTVFNHMVGLVTDFESFPYYFIPSTAYESDDRNKMDYSYYHNFMFNGNANSNLSSYFLSAVHSCIDLIEHNLDHVERIRLGMILCSNQEYTNEPHVDTFVPHKTGLLYLNDSDGDTIFYDKKYDSNSLVSPIEWGRSQELHEVERISPKANRLVIFDGLTYHASSKPIDTQYRLVLNFNFMEKNNG